MLPDLSDMVTIVRIIQKVPSVPSDDDVQMAGHGKGQLARLLLLLARGVWCEVLYGIHVEVGGTKMSTNESSQLSTFVLSQFLDGEKGG